MNLAYGWCVHVGSKVITAHQEIDGIVCNHFDEPYVLT